ncbi:hypothetical protein [Streptomyces sp. NPDC101206]|uniref:hypothetical protein n=1 Tax=Streptomyces sp. NPDC101206 TaxID=3366128 RepID=UPI00380613D5
MSGSRDHRRGAKRFRTNYDQPRGKVRRRVDEGRALRYAVEQTRKEITKAEGILDLATRGIGAAGSAFDTSDLIQLSKNVKAARDAHQDAADALERWEYDRLSGSSVTDTPSGRAHKSPVPAPEPFVVSLTPPPASAQRLDTAAPAAPSPDKQKDAPDDEKAAYKRLVARVEGREAGRFGARVQRSNSSPSGTPPPGRRSCYGPRADVKTRIAAASRKTSPTTGRRSSKWTTYRR